MHLPGSRLSPLVRSSTGKDVKLITSAKGLANNRIILNVTKTFHDQHPDLVQKVSRR